MTRAPHPLEEVRDSLQRSLGSAYQHESWAPRLALIETLYPLNEAAPGGEDFEYVPLAWIETHRAVIEASVGGTLENNRGLISVETVMDCIHGPQTTFFRSIHSDLYEWREANGIVCKPWFATGDYGGTGEGSTQTFFVCQAYDEADFLIKVVDKVGAYMSAGFELFETLPDNHIAKMFVTDKMTAHIERWSEGHMTIFMESHVNFS